MRAVPTPLSLAPLFAIALFASPVTAATVAYDTGLANPDTTIDFGGLADGTTVGSLYAAQGVTFGGLTATSQFGSTLGSTTAPAAANFASGQSANTVFTIAFASAVSAAEFFLYTDGYGTTITSTLGGNTVESLRAGQYASNGADYFGFVNSLFDGITVNVGGTGTAVIDNLQLASTASLQAVPEPGSSGLVIIGLAGLAGLGARRRV